MYIGNSSETNMSYKDNGAILGDPIVYVRLRL